MKQPYQAPTATPGPAASKPRRPILVKAGSSVARIYGLADGYFQGSITIAGERIRWTCKNLGDARREAERLVGAKESGAVAAGKLSASELESFTHARTLLSRLGDAAPPLHVAVAEYVAAREEAIRAGAGEAGVLALVRAQLAAREEETRGDAAPGLTAAEALARMLEAKADRPMHVRYERQLRRDLGAFAAAHPGPLRSIRAAAIVAWLRGLGVQSRRRENILGTIITLFRFAKRTLRALPADRTTEPELLKADLDLRGDDEAPPEIYEPGEIARLLAVAPSPWLPVLAIGFFAGIRAEEIQKLEWRDVRWDLGQIHVRPEVAKRIRGKRVGRARWVPMRENLQAWLSRWRAVSGATPVHPRYPNGKPRKSTADLAAIARESGTGPWRRNAPRHSCASYRLAETQNAAAVAHELGNSADVIYRRYHNARTPAEAVAWGAIRPARTDNVVPMTGGAAS